MLRTPYRRIADRGRSVRRQCASAHRAALGRQRGTALGRMRGTALGRQRSTVAFRVLSVCLSAAGRPLWLTAVADPRAPSAQRSTLDPKHWLLLQRVNMPRAVGSFTVHATRLMANFARSAARISSMAMWSVGIPCQIERHRGIATARGPLDETDVGARDEISDWRRLRSGTVMRMTKEQH